jgi:hypothetical protein
MKKTLLIATLICFVFGFVTVQGQSNDGRSTARKQQEAQQKEKAEQALAKNPNAPVIEFNKLIHDYGDIEQNADGSCEFEFTNKGKEPLILSNVRSSCGCTVPVWPRQPILPGQSDVIKVKYNTKRLGLINKSVQVYSNATEKTVVLKIKGKVHAQKSAMPEKSKESAGTPVNR